MNNIEVNEKQIKVPILSICKKGIFITLPIIIVLFAIYYILRGGYDVLNYPWKTYFITFGIFALLFILHELSHYILYLVYTSFDYKNIKIGTDEEYLKPYCKCFKEIDINKFKINKIMPCIIIGILPYIISLILGNFFLMLGSLCSIIVCGADIALIIQLRACKNIKMIKDNEVSYGNMIYDIKC